MPLTARSLLVRGLVAGLLAGLLAGLFALFVGEPPVDQAIAIEEAQAAAEPEPSEESPFSRPAQKAGLFLATGVTGLALGALFALAYALTASYRPVRSPWTRSLALAGDGFLAVVLLPFLRYPANPPAVGDSDTVGARTLGWLAAIVIGLGAVVLAAHLRERVLPRGRPLADSAWAAVLVAALALVFLVVPANPDQVSFPSTLLWEFRLTSLATSALLWAALGAAFGLLGERAVRSRPPANHPQVPCPS